MPGTFRADGVRFQYPDNWQLSREESANGWTAAVHSPETAFILVTLERDMPEVEVMLDTLKEPLHLDKNGEVRRFDRVIANPPFSQNCSTEAMKFKERFTHFMPESGKKADLMFVQHMVASLKSDGKLAVVMPHGVLFRAGEEKACRQRFIKDGVLEAAIGLPSNLFYGTGIPACVLVINKNKASSRKDVLFINADREYREGKNQNSLRPEDIEKITRSIATGLPSRNTSGSSPTTNWGGKSST